MRKIHWVITTTSTDTEIKTTPNASWLLDPDILTHPEFVKLQYDKINAFTVWYDFHLKAVRQCIRTRTILSLSLSPSLSLSLSQKIKSQSNNLLVHVLRFEVTLPCIDVPFAGRTVAMPFWVCKILDIRTKLTIVLFKMQKKKNASTPPPPFFVGGQTLRLTA